MAYSENLASLQQWSFRSSFTDSWMISDAFSRETETLTKALQQSLSRDSETLTDTNNSSFHQLVKPEPAPTVSGSDPETTSKRRNSISNGKITKRKSRATKRSPVTFIAADPTNFRQMVQQVTGIRFGNNEHVPVTPVIKPEPKRPGDLLSSYSLPTLDTSAFLLDQQLLLQQQQQQQSQMMGPSSTSPASLSYSPVVVDNGGVGLDFDYQNFPTLESWGVM